MQPANIGCFRHIGLTLTALSHCCAVHSQCIEESAGCTISFSGCLTIGHLLPDSKIDARERISNSICSFPCCSIWWSVGTLAWHCVIPTLRLLHLLKNPGLPLYLDQRMHYLSCGLWTEILALKNYPL